MRGRISHYGFGLFCLFFVNACGSDTSASVSLYQSAQQTLTTNQCIPNELPLFEKQEFIHPANNAFADHQALHAAQDVIVAPDEIAQIKSWFDYGFLSHPLIDETIHVFTASCQDSAPTDPTSWQYLTDISTDNHGHANLALDTKTASQQRIPLLFQVAGDQTQVRSNVYVLPKGTKFVVFDIDGTLSRNNRSLAQQLAGIFFHYEKSPEAYEGAAQLTHLWQSKGYVPLYLTNRPHLLSEMTRTWLQENHFAEGPLKISHHPQDLAPVISGAGAYKLSFLRSLQSKGYEIAYAYGNEPTDMFAYSSAGIDLEHVFSIGRSAGLQGTQPIQGDYLQHVDFVQNQPDA